MGTISPYLCDARGAINIVSSLLFVTHKMTQINAQSALNANLIHLSAIVKLFLNSRAFIISNDESMGNYGTDANIVYPTSGSKKHETISD